MASKKSITDPVRPYLPEIEEDLWQYLLLEILPLMKMGKTMVGILQVFETSDTAAEVAKVLNQNQYFGEVLQKAVDEKELDVKARDDANAAVLLGMLNTRNYICATQLWKTTHGEELKDTDFKKTLYFANKTEDIAQKLGVKSRPMWAYTSGLIFDFYRELMGIDERFDKKAMDWLNTQFERGLKAARMAHLISTSDDSKDSFLFQRQAFAVTLLGVAGSVLLCFLDPENYPKFLDKANDERLPPPGIQVAEEAWFGVSHSQMAALLASHYPMFNEFVPALLCMNHPQILKADAKTENLYLLSAAARLSTNAVTYQLDNMINSFKLKVPWTEKTLEISKQQAHVSL